jgi:hypothetical protein
MPIYGQVQLGGASVGVGGTTLASAFIDFFSTLPNCNVAGVGTPGCFTAGNGTGSFVTGSTAVVEDFTAATTGGHVSGAISIPDWMVFSNGVILDLTYVYAGVGVDCASLTPAQLAAAGTVCTPHVGTETGPFTMANLGGSQVSVSISMAGLGYTVDQTGGATTILGSLSTQFAGTNIATLLGTINAGGEIVNSYSGTFNAVPEPGTAYGFIGGALLLVPALIRRRVGKK